MAGPGKLKQINAFLTTVGWVERPVSVSFLAAGEYNANYLVKGQKDSYVLRINQGSQLNLGHDQIAYEYKVLEALAGSGVTPRPIACHPHPEPLGGGALLMTYLPGKALVYKIPLILPHIAVAFVVLVVWSQSGILASVAHWLGLIRSMNEFPNLLYSGWGIGMILA